MNHKRHLLSVWAVLFALVLVVVVWRGATHMQTAVAAGNAPSHSDTSSGFLLPNILLVDDDDNAPDVLPYYTQILDALGYYTYTVWDTDNTDVEPDAAFLSNYQAVIWFTGAEYGGAAGPGASGEAALSTWLDSGGTCLFMSSQDYYFDRVPSSSNPTPFMTNYLGVSGSPNPFGGDVVHSILTGTHSYEGIGPVPITSTLFSNFSDAYSITTDAEAVFIGDHTSGGGSGGLTPSADRQNNPSTPTAGTASHIAGVSKETSAYQTTWLGFPIELLQNPLAQYQILHRFLSNCFATDLQTINTVSAPVVQMGQPYTYTIEVVNNGPYRATDITVKDFVPNSANVIAIYDTQTFLCNLGTGQNLTCSIPVLEVGQSETMSFVVIPNVPGPLINFVFSTNFSADAVPANNSTSAFVRVLAGGDTSLYLDKVTPNAVDREFGGVLYVTGANFSSNTEVSLNGVPLTHTLDLNHPDALLQAYVPPGFEAGEFNFVAMNPGGNPDLLFKSVVVYVSNDLQIDAVLPEFGANDRPVLLNILGGGFSPGMFGELWDTSGSGVTYPLEAMNFISTTLVRAQAPYGLPEGAYDVVLYNPSENYAISPQPYHSLDWAGADDLGAFAFDLFTVPASPREGQLVTVGLTVRRHTGPLAPFSDSPVSVDVNLGLSGGGLGTPTVVLSATGVISPNSTLSITVPWTPALAGLYHLSMDITSADLGVDTIPGNNLVDRHLVVLPASSDMDAPVITNLSINEGTLLTALPTVLLNATATDVGSGVSQIYYIDYAFDRNLGDWYPAKQSGWLPYETSHTNFEWLLDSTAGVHYLQAWVSDGAGNISAQKSAFINLVFAKNTIPHDGGQVYRFPLLPLTLLQIDLTSLTGDADIYAWASDGTLAAAAFGSNPFEQISLAAGINPPGLYQIDVYGFEATSYWFEVTTGGVGSPEGVDEVKGHLKGSDTPLLQVINIPGSDFGLPQPTTTMHLFLPLVIR